MAKVIDFVFDDDEIAYTDASGCTYSTRSFLNAAAKAPYSRTPKDEFLIIPERSSKSSLVSGSYDYWRIWAPLHSEVKQWWADREEFPVWPYKYWRKCVRDIGFLRPFLGFLDMMKNWPPTYEFFTLSGKILSLQNGVESDLAWFAPISLMPITVIDSALFSFKSIVPLGGSIIASYAISDGFFVVPDDGDFVIIDIDDPAGFLTPGITGFQKFLWFRVFASRPPGDFTSPLSMSEFVFDIHGSFLP